jgi:signal transduction histidine kinase
MIVEKLGGHISVSNGEKSGAVFCVILPLVKHVDGDHGIDG